MKGKQKKPIKKTQHKKKEIKKEENKNIIFCPRCNSTFVHKVIRDDKSFFFRCSNCGHVANFFPEIEPSKIRELPPVKSVKNVTNSENKVVKYDPVSFILSIIIGIILIIFGAYLLYESLVLASIIYAALSIIGGLFVIINSIKHRNKYGIKK